MQITLPPEIEALVREHLAHGCSRSPESVLTKALYALREQETMSSALNTKQQKTQPEVPAEESAPSVLDIFQAAREAIPEEEMQALPLDGAEQHDHYIYGTPKRPV